MAKWQSWLDLHFVRITILLFGWMNSCIQLQPSPVFKENIEALRDAPVDLTTTFTQV